MSHRLHASSPTASAGRDTRVLVADDDQAVRCLLVAIIDGADGFCVAGEAADGHEALAETLRSRPDIVLLDLAMPNRSGLDALPDIREAAPAAIVVVLSGFSADAVAARAIALGADLYLEKGVNPELLVAELRMLVAARAVEPVL